MPFHSVKTEEEAESLITLYCRLNFDGRMMIKQEWDDQDIIRAMQSAAKQFGLKPVGAFAS